MTTVRDHHDFAMSEVNDAILCRFLGNEDESRAHYVKALPHELAAIKVLEDVSGTGPDTEPTRSILYLSAASLAWCAGDNVEARRLIDIGLAGSPTPRTKADLLELRESAT
jgi:hypothetical protein